MVVTDQMDGLPLDPITCSGQMPPIIFKPSLAQAVLLTSMYLLYMTLDGDPLGPS